MQLLLCCNSEPACLVCLSALKQDYRSWHPPAYLRNLSVRCPLDITAVKGRRDSPLQSNCLEAFLLLPAGNADIALQHSAVKPGGFMLEATLLLVEAKKDLSQEALV